MKPVHLLAIPILLAPAAAAAAAAAAPQHPTDPQRAEILAVARRYAEFRWTPTKANILHGKDPDGVQVDTPDRGYRKTGYRVGAEHVGVPYQWGGFSSLEQFAAGVREGKLAGHLPKRGSARSSRHAVGVDCSGFVSRCWDLPRKHSTRSIASVCYVLDDFSELLAGDILNSFDGHVVLFARFGDAAKTKFEVYEAGSAGVKRSTYSLETLQKRGYKPLRYKPLDPRWRHQDLGTATWVRTDGADFTFTTRNSTGRRSRTRAGTAFDRGRRGDWVRYAVSGGSTTTRALLDTTPTATVIRTVLSVAGKHQHNEVRRARGRPLPQALVDFAGRDQKFGRLTPRSIRITDGRVRIGERWRPCRRIHAVLETTLLSRSVHYPVTIRVTCLQSDAVPMSGILRAHFGYTLTRPDRRQPIEWGTILTLEAFRRT